MSEDQINTDWIATNNLAFEWRTKFCYEIIESVAASEKKEAKRTLKKRAVEQKQEEIKLQQQKDIAESAKQQSRYLLKRKDWQQKKEKKILMLTCLGNRKKETIKTIILNQNFIHKKTLNPL